MNTTLSYPEIIAWIEKKGIELYGKKFKILETDHEIIYKLIAYFLQDEKTCHEYGINLNKGILLTGPIGCGKTSLMNLMKLLAQPENKFAFFAMELPSVKTKFYTSTLTIDMGMKQILKIFGKLSR